MDKSIFGADESCVPNDEDLLSSTVLVGDEDHKRDELKLSPIFGDSSPSGKVGLRYRNSALTKANNDSREREDSEKCSSANSLGLSLDSFSAAQSGEQSDASQIEGECGNAAFIEEKENASTSSSKENSHRTPESSRSDTRLNNESKRAINPFERSVCADSLSRSIFSPGILAELSNLPKNTPKTATKGEFKWSIEHLAVLNPVDIPEEDIIRSRISPSFHDPTKQAAIENFFRSNAAFHPSPDIFRKPPTPLAAPSAKRLRQMEGNSFKLPSSSSKLQPSPLTRPVADRMLRTGQLQRVRSFSTQTTLSIPPSEDIDLIAILGARFEFDEKADREARISEGIIEEEEERDLSASNLSLRRRLFLEDDEEEEEDDEEGDGEGEDERSALAIERTDILTPLSSNHSSSPSISNGNRSTSSLLEDLGSASRGTHHLTSPSPSRLRRMPLPFPDFSPIAPNP